MGVQMSKGPFSAPLGKEPAGLSCCPAWRRYAGTICSGPGPVLARPGGPRWEEEKESGLGRSSESKGALWAGPAEGTGWPQDMLLRTELFLRGSVSPFFSSSTRGLALNPHSSCNKNCRCQTDSFTPVCGADGVTYLSACFAGCNSTVMGRFGWGTARGASSRAASSPRARAGAS